ncbi:MAG: ribonuclease HI family protein [Candidatus Saccharimonadales bacterium]
MSAAKPTHTKRETVALAALQQGIAIIKKGHHIYGLHPDGSKELISKSRESKDVWRDALTALQSRQNIEPALNKNSVTTENSVENTTKLRIYSDGGSRGNPGPSASGFVILTENEDKLLEQGGQYLGITTNNQAEYQAVKHALEAARKFKPTAIDFCMDSLLVANQLNGIFKVKNKELWPVYNSIKVLAEEIGNVTFRHVYREHNTLADEQVNIILDEEAKLQNG